MLGPKCLAQRTQCAAGAARNDVEDVARGLACVITDVRAIFAVGKAWHHSIVQGSGSIKAVVQAFSGLTSAIHPPAAAVAPLHAGSGKVVSTCHDIVSNGRRTQASWSRPGVEPPPAQAKAPRAGASDTENWSDLPETSAAPCKATTRVVQFVGTPVARTEPWRLNSFDVNAAAAPA